MRQFCCTNLPTRGSYGWLSTDSETIDALYVQLSLSRLSLDRDKKDEKISGSGFGLLLSISGFPVGCYDRLQIRGDGII